MKYEIAYISQSGNTEKLAHGIADRLPHHTTFVTDLATEEITQKADVYLIGFGVNKGMVPLRVMEVLDKLHGKTSLFFVTSGLNPVKEYKELIERKLSPFMPDECDYRGLFMCPGKFPDAVLESARRMLEADADNKMAIKVLEDAELSQDHPNETDFENAYRFVKEHLGL